MSNIETSRESLKDKVKEAFPDIEFYHSIFHVIVQLDTISEDLEQKTGLSLKQIMENTHPIEHGIDKWIFEGYNRYKKLTDEEKEKITAIKKQSSADIDFVYKLSENNQFKNAIDYLLPASLYLFNEKGHHISFFKKSEKISSINEYHTFSNGFLFEKRLNLKPIERVYNKMDVAYQWGLLEETANQGFEISEDTICAVLFGLKRSGAELDLKEERKNLNKILKNLNKAKNLFDKSRFYKELIRKAAKNLKYADEKNIIKTLIKKEIYKDFLKYYGKKISFSDFIGYMGAMLFINKNKVSLISRTKTEEAQKMDLLLNNELLLKLGMISNSSKDFEKLIKKHKQIPEEVYEQSKYMLTSLRSLIKQYNFKEYYEFSFWTAGRANEIAAECIKAYGYLDYGMKLNFTVRSYLMKYHEEFYKRSRDKCKRKKKDVRDYFLDLLGTDAREHMRNILSGESLSQELISEIKETI